MPSMAARIRWIMKSRGLSGRALAKLAKLSPTYINTLTAGRTQNPTKDSLNAISKAAGVRLEWLMRGVEPREPYESADEVAIEYQDSRERAASAARILGISEVAIRAVLSRDEKHDSDPGPLYWYHQIEAEACRLAKLAR
jgi:transcriptional regulator with XRE-family HTH domain